MPFPLTPEKENLFLESVLKTIAWHSRQDALQFRALAAHPEAEVQLPHGGSQAPACMQCTHTPADHTPIAQKIKEV